MTETTAQTPLDTAYVTMAAAPDDTPARLAWFDQLAGSEMILLLEEEPAADRVRPRVFTVDGADLVLAFDREERLSGFAGGAAAYVALSGRALVQMLSDAGLGLGINLGTPFETVLETEAVAWLSGTLDNRPSEVEDRPDRLLPPKGLPERLLSALDARLASAEGRAAMAYLVATAHDDGRRGHLIGFIDPMPGAEGALVQLVSEALTFSGLEAASLDIGFFRTHDPICARLAEVGLRFDLPDLPGVSEIKGPVAPPGSDPDKPPRLR